MRVGPLPSSDQGNWLKQCLKLREGDATVAGFEHRDMRIAVLRPHLKACDPLALPTQSHGEVCNANTSVNSL